MDHGLWSMVKAPLLKQAEPNTPSHTLSNHYQIKYQLNGIGRVETSLQLALVIETQRSIQTITNWG